MAYPQIKYNIKRVSPHCSEVCSLLSEVYEEAVKLRYDLVMERPVYARGRLDVMLDVAPGAVQMGTTKEERTRIEEILAEINKAVDAGDMASAASSAEQLVASVRMALLNAVAWCEHIRLETGFED